MTRARAVGRCPRISQAARGGRRSRARHPVDDIAEAAGHVSPNVARAVYRHQISDTVTRAPAVLNQALRAGGEQA